MNQSKEFLRSNIEVIEKWGAFVDVCQQNGESRESIKARLAANNLAPEQVEMLMDKRSELYYQNALYIKNLRRYLIGIPLLIASPILMTFEIGLLHNFPVAGMLCMGFGLKVLATIKKRL